MVVKSKQARKQRKDLFNLSLHKKRKQMSAHLSKELRKKHKKRSIPLRTGDTIKIVTGEYKGKTGKVNKVNLTKRKIKVEKILRKKVDGTEKEVWVIPSNVIITELNLEDKERKKVLERK
jgi:large subunit ribosomal protein L24